MEILYTCENRVYVCLVVSKNLAFICMVHDVKLHTYYASSNVYNLCFLK